MAKQDDLDALEKLKAAAAAKGDFDSFQRAHRQAEALRGGKSYINGQPAAVALGAVEAPVASPAGPPAPVAAALPYDTNEAQVANIKAYGVGGFQGAPKDADGVPMSLDQVKGLQTSKYNQFLLDQGINPGTIGNASISENGTLDVPSLKQEQTAQDIANQVHGVHNQYNIAANRAMRDRNPALGLQLQQDAAEVAPQVAGRSAYGNLQYWLNRLRGQVQTAQSNGYAPRPRAVSYANQLP